MRSRPRTPRAPQVAAAGAALAGLAAGCGGESDAEAQQEPEEVQELSSGEVLRDERAPDGHPLREVPAEEAPTVSLEVEPDPHDGWNVHLDVEGFAFTPQASGGSAHGGRGHAHLYVDDEKYGRLYGPWFHLPYEAIGDGEHTVMVTLNADDHTTWAVDGEAVQAEQEVVGGGPGRPPPPPPPPAGAPAGGGKGG
jgi:hypothetical protein